MPSVEPLDVEIAVDDRLQAAGSITAVLANQIIVQVGTQFEIGLNLKVEEDGEGGGVVCKLLATHFIIQVGGSLGEGVNVEFLAEKISWKLENKSSIVSSDALSPSPCLVCRSSWACIREIGAAWFASQTNTAIVWARLCFPTLFLKTEAPKDSRAKEGVLCALPASEVIALPELCVARIVIGCPSSLMFCVCQAPKDSRAL